MPDDPPGSMRPRTFEELLQSCPEPYKEVLVGSLTDPAEIAVYRAEIFLHGMEITPLLPHEWTLLRDIGEMAVEIWRYRRIEAQLLNEGRRQVLEALLVKGDWDLGQAVALANADVAGDARSRQQVDKYLSRAHLTRHVIDARAHERHPPDAIHRMISDVSKRRDRLVRELHSGNGVHAKRSNQT